MLSRRKFSFAAFQDGTGQIPNNPLVATVFTALFKAGPEARKLVGGWSLNESGTLEVRHLGRKGGQISVKIADGLIPRTNGRRDTEAQWSVIEGFTSLAADAAMAILAELCQPSAGRRTKFPMMQSVTITADHVLRYKKFRRFGIERQDFRRRIAEEFKRLQMLRIDIVNYPGWDVAQNRWNKNGVSIFADKLFELTEADLVLGEDHDVEHVWLARLGAWAQIWMNAQSKVWTIQVPQSVLEFDHRKTRLSQSFSKKLALHGLMLGGIAHDRPVVVRRIDHLLEDLGELPDESHRTNHWAGRTRDRLEEAAMQLTERGVFKKIDWSEEFGPGSIDRHKGWTNSWLASKLQLTLPEHSNDK